MQDAVSHQPLPLRRLALLTSAYGAAPVLERVASLLLLPVLTHWLQPREYGQLILLYAAGSAAAIIVFLGLPDSLQKLFWDFKEEDRAKALGSVSIGLLVVGVVLLGITAANAVRLSVLITSSPAYAGPVFLLSIKTAIAAQVVVPYAVTRAKERVVYLLAGNLIGVLTRLVLIPCLVIWGGLGISGVLLGEIAANSLSLAAYWRGAWDQIQFNFQTRSLGHVFSIAPFQLALDSLGWVTSISDRLLLQGLLHLPAEIGRYAVAYTFGSSIGFFLTPAIAAWRPYVYAVNFRSGDHYGKKMSQGFSIFTIGAGTAFALVGAYSYEAILVMTPKPYHAGARELVWIVAVGHVFAQLSNFFTSTFFIRNRLPSLVKIYALSAGSNVALNFLLIPRIGVNGAAWATMVGYGVLFLCTLLYSQRIFPIAVNWRQVAAILVAGLALGSLLLVVSTAPVALSVLWKSALLAGIAAIFWRNQRKSQTVFFARSS